MKIERPTIPQWEPSSPETAVAYTLGAKGCTTTDDHRRQFEDWMAGHMWKCGKWVTRKTSDGKEYSHYRDRQTRCLFAAFQSGMEVGLTSRP